MLVSTLPSLLKRVITPFKILTVINYSKLTANNYSKLTFDIEMKRIVWVDLEMTGLDVNKDTIMEIACVVTDTDLNIIAESPDLIIHTPEQKLNEMNEWCINQHRKTGLSDAAKNSVLSIEKAEAIILSFVKDHVTEKASPLAGNSVYMDRIFMQKYMPTLNNYLHYRIIDVSTVKELCRRWNYSLYKEAPEKEYSHRALSDIRESIEELKFYKQNFFNVKL